MKGFSTIFDHKKWVFTYFVVGMVFWKLESSDVVALLIVLIPFVIGANSFDKSKYCNHTDKE